MEVLKEAGSVYGHFAKDSYSSDFAKAWKSVLKENSVEVVNSLNLLVVYHMSITK